MIMSRTTLEIVWDHRRQADYAMKSLYGPVHDLSKSELDVLAFIAAEPDVTISKIINHNYFRKVSFSTVKRVIIKLKGEGLVTSRVGDDRRSRYLECSE